MDQDYPHLEYIVMDGGSTDGSVRIIERFEEKLDYWRSEPDAGQADAINRGWDRATGDVLGWLNSDDLLEPGALAAVGRAFSRNPGVRVVHGDCRVIGRQGEPRRIKQSADTDLERQLLGKSLPQPSVFVHRSVVDAVGGLDPSLEYTLDWGFFLRVFLHVSPEHAVHLSRCLSCSRVYEGTKTRTGLEEKGAERRRILEELERAGLLEEFSRWDRRRFLGGTYWIQAADEWTAGRTIRSLASAIRGFLYDPARLGKAVSVLPWLARERQRRSTEPLGAREEPR